LKFPCLGLAYKALASGGSAPAILNAANEVAVEAFLKSQIAFTAIPSMIEHVMQTINPKDIFTLEDVLTADSLAREAAYDRLNSKRIDS
jgi:1-deoxy-D-xylulose-5-phosphate reductoisomerase